MMFKKTLSALLISCLWSYAFIFPGFAGEQSAEILTLKETIAKAIAANLQLQSSQEGTRAALATKEASKTEFFPTFSAIYQYSENDESADIGGITIGLEREYSFRTSVTQPIFRGFSLVNQYEISKLGLDVSQTNEKLIRQDIIFNAQKVYFSLLQAQKLLNVADETVTQINAQRNVAKNFYDVGMRPLNDFLQAEVELANAEQDRIVARNNLSNAESDFNILLRRSMDTPVAIQDVIEYASFEHDLEYCYAEAEKNRLEIKIAELEVDIAAKELKLSRKDYYPSVDLQGSYFKSGTDFTVDGGERVFDTSGWNILATASWNFWEWGRTTY
jgi:outer membrane protein TolC